MPGLSYVPEAVGLQLLLNGNSVISTVIARAACTTVGVAYPIYASFKSIEARRQDSERLMYWSVFGLSSFAESFLDQGLYWLPYYYHAKLLFLLWLQAPSCRGATRLYRAYLRPFLLRHQQRIEGLLSRFRQFGYSPEVLALTSLWRHAVATVPGLQHVLARDDGSDDEDYAEPRSPPPVQPGRASRAGDVVAGR